MVGLLPEVHRFLLCTASAKAVRSYTNGFGAALGGAQLPGIPHGSGISARQQRAVC